MEKDPSLIGYMNEFRIRPIPNATIRGLLVNAQKNQPKGGNKNFFLTDLCNPLQFYVRQKYPEKFQPTSENRKFFAVGNRIHGIMEKAVEKMPNFVDTEANLDGNMFGIPVRGRMDAETKESIFEFKSKQDLPKTVEELLEKYPHDVEQLGFYAFLDPIHREENYLVFISQDEKFQLKAFKITIKNFEEIGRELKKRAELLEKVMKGEESPSIFLKCRRCSEECILNKESLCEHIKNPNLDCCITKFIAITPAEDIEKEFASLLKYEQPIDIFSLYNIITSRKTLHIATTELELEPPEKDEEKKKNEIYFEELFYKSGMSISVQEYKDIIKKNKIQNIYLKKKNFLKIGEEIYPCIIQASMSKHPPVLMNPSDYKVGELGILANLTGFTKGYLLIYYPNLKEEIRAFEVSFNFTKDTLRKLKGIVEILLSKDASKINLLPLCPDFMHQEGCAFTNICPQISS